MNKHIMEFIGSSKTILGAIEKAKLLSQNDFPCLIVGEKGTGKTHLAHFIHSNSKREAEGFVVMDAANTGDFEKQLFGYIKTSLLRSENIASGAIDTAGSGTLLIKNLHCVPPEFQPQLIATIELLGYRPVGSNEVLKASCRFIFTLPSPPERYLAEHKLIPELIQPISRNTIALPKLLDRPQDIELLADHFIRKWCGNLGLPPKTLTKAAIKLLKKSTWPGNIAELQLLLLNTIICFSGNTIDTNHLQTRIDGNWHPYTEKQLEEIALEDIVEKKLKQFMQRLGKYDIENLHNAIIERVERPLIKLAMERANNNQIKASKILGINRNTLRTKLQKLEII